MVIVPAHQICPRVTSKWYSVSQSLFTSLWRLNMKTKTFQKLGNDNFFFIIIKSKIPTIYKI